MGEEVKGVAAGRVTDNQSALRKTRAIHPATKKRRVTVLGST